jgi:sialic acid synthase SpsE
VAKTGKPIIMSTGMATVEEIKEAVDAARDSGCNDLILLKCTSAYPATPADANLNTMADIRESFNVQVGLSDHTMGIAVPIAATILGVTVIEKHFTLSRNDGGVDSAFSLEPDELKSLVVETKRAFESLGQIKYGGSKSEEKNKVFRRSLYAVKDIKKGEFFTIENTRAIRPGYGLSPKYYKMVMGKKAKCNIELGTPLDFNLIEDIS